MKHVGEEPPDTPQGTGRRKIRQPDVTLQITVPPRVKKAISVRALRTGTTNRTVVLQALRDSGISVSDDELLDRRKVRS